DLWSRSLIIKDRQPAPDPEKPVEDKLGDLANPNQVWVCRMWGSPPRTPQESFRAEPRSVSHHFRRVAAPHIGWFFMFEEHLQERTGWAQFFRTSMSPRPPLPCFTYNPGKFCFFIAYVCGAFQCRPRYLIPIVHS